MEDCFFLVGSLSEHLEKPIKEKQQQQYLSNKFNIYVRNICKNLSIFEKLKTI